MSRAELAPSVNAASGLHRDVDGPLPTHDPSVLARIEVFLVTSAATVLITRLYLAAAGYPQVGGGSLHIAHVLWGGLLMGIALLAMAAAIGSGTRFWACLIGGIGFGLFIDEVGKFVTKDVDYFYSPATSIIYTVLIAGFVISREIVVRRRLSASRVRALAGMAYADREIGQLSRQRLRLIEAMLRETNSPAEAEMLMRLVSQATTKSRQRSADEIVSRLADRVLALIAAPIRFRWVRSLVFILMSAQALASLASLIFLVVAGALEYGGIELSAFNADTFWLIGEAAQTLAISIGILLYARHHVLAGLQLVRTALLIELMYTNVWRFDSDPVGALINFGVVSILLTIITALIRAAQTDAANAAGLPADL